MTTPRRIQPLQLEASKSKTTKILLVEDNPGDVRLVRETLASQSIARFDMIAVSRLGDALMRLRGEPFDAVLLDLSLPDSQGLDTLSRMRRRAPLVPIVVMTGQSDEAFAVNAVNEGAQDYLVKGDIDSNALARRIRFAVERTRASSAHALAVNQPKLCKTLGFLGSKGGVGTSTLACYLGIALQDQTKEPVLLADFDFESGILAFLMEIEPTYSLGDVLQNADRLDKDIWNSLVQKKLTGLDVIPSSFALASDYGTNRQLQEVISFARSSYRWIIADLGRGCHSKLSGLLEEIDEICIVTTVDLPALRLAKLILQELLQIGYHIDCIRLLVNELPTHPAYSAERLEKMLGSAVWATLPYFPELRENHQRSLSLSRSAIPRKAIDRIAGLITGIPEEKPKGRWPFWTKFITERSESALTPSESVQAIAESALHFGEP